MREAELKIVLDNDYGLRGPDTYTRIRLTINGKVMYELKERRSYEIAKMVARHWTAEGRVLQHALEASSR